MKIAIQGVLGSFHQIASEHFYANVHGASDRTIQYIYCESFHDVFSTLQMGQADVAVVAIENSLYGSINEVYDLLLSHDFSIIGEIAEHIHQNLITFPGVELADIKQVYSHPVALAQCAGFLEAELPDAAAIEHYDTAAAVEYVKQAGDRTAAAIASHLAAEIHGMQLLRTSIQDEHDNYTRFLVIAPASAAPEAAQPDASAAIDKASLVLATSHQPGALHKALGVFADLGCNLTKLQSRPMRGKVWEYQFYIDVSISPTQLAAANKQLTDLGCTVTTLGSYHAAETSFSD